MNDVDLVSRVRAERKRRKWTQREVAERAGVSVRAYQYFEGRQGAPQPENLRSILEALDLELVDDEIAAVTRSEWPADVTVFLDVLGAYLTNLDSEDRRAYIHDATRDLFAQ